MAKSPEEQEAAMVASLAEKTGKSMPQWLKLVAAQKAAKHGEIVKWLKEQGVTHGYANLIAHYHLRSSASLAAEGGEDLLGAQYAGGKEALRPIYDELAKRVAAFGADVEFAPKKGYMSLRRSKQFALIQPSTKTRVDVGIQLKDVAASGRLEKSGSFNAMVSHRVRVESLADVDEQLIGWLREAYERA